MPITLAHVADAFNEDLEAWNVVYDRHNEVACLMLGSMSPKLQRQFKNYSPYDVLRELKSMFEKQAGVELFELIQTFHASKQEEGQSISSYLDCQLPFEGFVCNYNMHSMGKTISELHAILIEYKKGLPKKAATPQVLRIQGGRI
ncbi:hypothetical protein Tco_0321533 [Tanacetum coccineum]